jgi:hypothetical protein
MAIRFIKSEVLSYQTLSVILSIYIYIYIFVYIYIKHLKTTYLHFLNIYLSQILGSPDVFVLQASIITVYIFVIVLHRKVRVLQLPGFDASESYASTYNLNENKFSFLTHHFDAESYVCVI